MSVDRHLKQAQGIAGCAAQPIESCIAMFNDNSISMQHWQAVRTVTSMLNGYRESYGGLSAGLHPSARLHFRTRDSGKATARNDSRTPGALCKPFVGDGRERSMSRVSGLHT